MRAATSASSYGVDALNETISNFLKDQSGATAIEYGLIAALISVVIIAATRKLGTNLSSTFNKVASNVG